MTYAEAAYFQYLLICGYSQKLWDFLDQALITEDPLSDIILDLSLCTSDPKQALAVVNDFLRNIPDAQIDHNQLLNLTLGFLREQYQVHGMPAAQLVELMYRIAYLYLSAHSFDMDFWLNMYLADDFYTDAKTGYFPMEKFLKQLDRFLREGTPFSVWTPQAVSIYQSYLRKTFPPRRK